MKHFDEDDEEVTDEVKARMERLSQKMDKFMEDVSEDVLDAEDMERLETKLKKLLSENKMAFTLSNIIVFNEGMDFGMSSMRKLGPEIAMLMTGMKRLIKEKRVSIDISKSKMEGK